MTRFSARTSSSELDYRPTKNTNKRSKPPVVRPKAKLNRKAKPWSRGRSSRRSSLNFVYVGNLRSDVLNADLEKLFEGSGKVTEVVVRCCNGVVVPTTARSNSCYATVGFSTLEGATEALNMNGQDLHGRNIVVSPSFLGLPEAHRRTGRKHGGVLGVDFTNLSNTINRFADRWLFTGGTRIFEEDWDV